MVSSSGPVQQNYKVGSLLTEDRKGRICDTLRNKGVGRGLIFPHYSYREKFLGH
jgi:hypothetical protein